MKDKYFFLMISYFVLSLAAKAQIAGNTLDMGFVGQKNSEGVFLTAKDFTNCKISFSQSLTDRKYKFHLYDVSFRTPIKIVIGDNVIKLDKDSIFGYRDKKNVCYRFYNKVIYKILNPDEKILLYSTTSIKDEPKNIHRITNYFFSRNADCPLYPLSKWNLKTVFCKNINFNALLDVYFPDDKDLTAFYNAEKTHLLNRVYEMCEQPLCKMSCK
jgi:hypothetical protein